MTEELEAAAQPLLPPADELAQEAFGAEVRWSWVEVWRMRWRRKEKRKSM